MPRSGLSRNVLAISAHMLRMTRASVINVLAAPYIEMARLKGLSNRIVIGRHGRHHLVHAISGSPLHPLVDNSLRPVLVVPTRV